ncbi:histidinol-phosphate transaminase [candidate division KSB1 bacterium]|nr:histidinol-phosphate transaminase [candidate division KSB1 bacterium]RQW05598.1 MAG: histidinol-phosphate transaminase [candidate division KSB1 bacterium]
MPDYFKQSVLELHGYSSPPQRDYKVKLNQNESPFDVPQYLKDELAEAIKSLEWNRYPLNESPILMEKLAQRHNVCPEQIVLGNGSNQLFQTLLTATIAAGDVVISTPPTFSLYDLYTTIYDAKAVNILQAPGTPYPVEQVTDAIAKHQPKLVLVCSPNNPTGGETDLAIVEQLCRASQGIIFFDEAYGEFSEHSAIPLLKKYDNLLISRTFSKAFSLAGLRFGYFVGQESVTRQLRKVNIPYNINLFTELVAQRLLENEAEMLAQVAYLKQERDRVAAAMCRIDGIITFPSAANFILFKGPNDLDLFHILKEYGILVRDVSSYPLLAGHQRVSMGFKEENDFFLETLEQIMHKYVGAT